MRVKRFTWSVVRFVAYGTVVPVFMMNAQSLDCASITSRAAWSSARRCDALGVGEPVRELHHPLGHLVQVPVDPGVAAVAPVVGVALLAPRRQRRRRHLVGRVLAQVAARRDRRDGALVVLELAEEELEEHRPLVPPVPEELRVVGRDDDRPAVHVRAQVLDLLLAIEHEVARVLGRAQVRDGAGRRGACRAVERCVTA